MPYLARFQPARFKATLVPLAILLCVAAAILDRALVLMVAAPLIPIFMALIGWRAKAASEAQLVEIGGMNAFLLDRLRGLATIRALDAVDATAPRLRADADDLRRRTMAVLRIAFLSSAVLELFSALGVAHGRGLCRLPSARRAAASAPGARKLIAERRACSSCCWRRPSSSRCASCRRSGTTARPARPRARRWPD